MKTMFENVWYWMADHPMLTIWFVACVQGLVINLLGGAD